MPSPVRALMLAALALVVAPFASAESNAAAGPKRVYVAAPLAADAPHIDGRLDDRCWSEAGTWAGDYTQFTPHHGGTPSQRTELKLLYDDRNLYVGIRAYDHEPALMTRFAAARDKFTGDIVGVTFDSYFDHRTAFEFDLTSAGQKIDLILTNDGWDTTWNPVWDGRVAHDERGWSAEMRIPLNQLRYNDAHPQVWGLHAWRWLARNSEESQWKLLANDGNGLVFSFGELQGLELPRPRRHLELTPYASGRYVSRADTDARGRRASAEIAAGGDAKLQLTTGLTLDATINPDFGQVEADPSEMNLTAFETFLSERRPFFIEGKNIFDFGFDDDEPLFYSRRIGHAPTLAASQNAYDVPESTTILGAWKVSGKTRQGLAVGVLHAITREEHAWSDDGSGPRAQSLEPATQYAVVRLQQEFNQGQTTLGGIATATLRQPKSTALADALPRRALVGGLDFEHNWNDRTYWIAGKAIATQVTGSPMAIARLQTASTHYFQRPDADPVTFDPSRRELAGWGAYVMAGKKSKGHWRYHEKLTAYSPGVDFNDPGYFREADRIRQHSEVAYVEKQPAAFYRDYELRVEQDNYWSYGREHLRSEVSTRLMSNLKNKAYAETEVIYTGESLDPVALRGGPALRVPASVYFGAYANTDAERRWVGSFSGHSLDAGAGTLREWQMKADLKYRPSTALTLSLGATRAHLADRRYYVPSSAADGSTSPVVSSLKNDSLTFTARVQWYLRPELSLEYYGSPFGSSGAYSGFERITAPRAADYASRSVPLPAPTLADGRYLFDDDGDGRADYSTRRPDFSFGQFRSNLVLRWEYRPGSNLYLVWSQERSDSRPDAGGSVGIIRRLGNTRATNVVLLKFSYWFSI